MSADDLGSKHPIGEDERHEQIERYVRNLKSRNPRVRAEAAKCLGQLRAEPAALLSALDDPNSFVRAAAAESLGHVACEKAAEVADYLLSAMDDPNDFVCAAAIRSLGCLQIEAARDQILAFLESPRPRVVQAAIMSLARLGPSSVGGHLMPFLDTENPYVRLAAARAVGILAYIPAGPKLLATMQSDYRSEDWTLLNLRRNYIEAIAKLQVKEAIPILTEIAQHEVGLRSIAIQALTDLNAESAVPTLARLLADPSTNLRKSLIKLMIRADFRAALPAIRPLLKDTNTPVRLIALSAVTQWRDLASARQIQWMSHRDPNPYIRPRALLSLVSLLGHYSLPDLLALANDSNAVVRQAVAMSLTQLKDLPAEAAETLSSLAADEQIAALSPTALTPYPLNPKPIDLLSGATTCGSLVPSDVRADSPILLAALERWQENLAVKVGRWQPDQIASLDQALTTLIIALRESVSVEAGDACKCGPQLV